MTNIYIGRPWIKQITFHTVCGLIHLIEGLKWKDWESRKRKDFCLPDCFWTQDRMESCQNFQPARLLYRFQISQFLSPNSTPKRRTDSLKETSLFVYITLFLFLWKTLVYPHLFRNRNEKQFRITSFSAACDSGSLAITFPSLLTADVGLWPRCGFLFGESASWALGLKRLKQSSSNSSYSPKTADFFQLEF